MIEEKDVGVQFDDYDKSGGPYRKLTNFRGLDMKGSYISLEKIETKIIKFDGEVVEWDDSSSTVPVSLGNIIEYCLDSGNKGGKYKGIWIKSSQGIYYLLDKPSKHYEPTHRDFSRKIEIWLEIWNLMLDEFNFRQKTSKEIVTFLKNRKINEDEVIKYRDFFIKRMKVDQLEKFFAHEFVIQYLLKDTKEKVIKKEEKKSTPSKLERIIQDDDDSEDDEKDESWTKEKKEKKTTPRKKKKVIDSEEDESSLLEISAKKYPDYPKCVFCSSGRDFVMCDFTDHYICTECIKKKGLSYIELSEKSWVCPKCQTQK